MLMSHWPGPFQEPGHSFSRFSCGEKPWLPRAPGSVVSDLKSFLLGLTHLPQGIVWVVGFIAEAVYVHGYVWIVVEVDPYKCL